MISRITNHHVHCATHDTDVPNFKSAEKDEGIKDIFNDDQLLEKVEYILDKERQKEESREKYFCHFQETFSDGRIFWDLSSIQAREMRVKTEEELTWDDQISKYIHEKFDNIENKEDTSSHQHVYTKHSIQKITIYNKS